MSIDATSSVTAPSRASYQQIRNDYKALQSDLQSGNLANAQTDFATLLKDAPQLNAQLQSGAAATQPNALSALSTSLQAGDLSGAQTAFASLGQMLSGTQSALGSTGQMHHRHHHHHHHENNSASSALGGIAGNATTNQQAIQTDFQALSSALQSGNITSAQQAFAQLQTDDPALAQKLGAVLSSTTPTV